MKAYKGLCYLTMYLSLLINSQKCYCSSKVYDIKNIPLIRWENQQRRRFSFTETTLYVSLTVFYDSCNIYNVSNQEYYYFLCQEGNYRREILSDFRTCVRLCNLLDTH
jgi:hypothetical protein